MAFQFSFDTRWSVESTVNDGDMLVQAGMHEAQAMDFHFLWNDFGWFLQVASVSSPGIGGLFQAKVSGKPRQYSAPVFWLTSTRTARPPPTPSRAVCCPDNAAHPPVYPHWSERRDRRCQA